jgi:hypothetical protein
VSFVDSARAEAFSTAFRGLYLEISHSGTNTGLAEVRLHERGGGNIDASSNAEIGNMTGSGGPAAAFDT